MKNRISPLPNAPTGQLRLLQTTDLHMQLLDYDYFSNRTDPRIGLIGLADKISALSGDANITTLLCDNGDLLQGNPLADHLAQTLKPGVPHPMIAALNMLRYDAMTLGNHEFDYGLDFLQVALKGAQFPVVSANVTDVSGELITSPFAILERQIMCDDGETRTISIGITGFAPPQGSDWDDDHVGGDFQVSDIIAAAARVIPQIRDAGADIIVALCHAGIGAAEHTPRMENAALPLAAIDGVDVVLAGHTHEAFPNTTTSNTSEIDYANGTLHRKPAIMAEFCGKSLGVIDLTLRWDADTWQITGHNARLASAQAPQGTESPLRHNLRALVSAPHAATTAEIQRPIAQTDIHIVSYFATIQPDLSQQLLARAMQDAVVTMLTDIDIPEHPVLAATSSYRFGGRSGLGHYIDVPKGQITLRDAAAIFPFADRMCAVRRTGRQIRLWLERSATHYNQLQPGLQAQPLIDRLSAGYNNDAIFGLTYQIDLSQPARFDTSGRDKTESGARIVELRHHGNLIEDDDIFIVAANSFRARGGGRFPMIAPEDIIATSELNLRAILINYLGALGVVNEPVEPHWGFKPIPQTSAVFESALDGRHHLNAPISHVGPGKQGLETYRITL